MIVIEVLAAGILPILTVVVLAEAVGRIFEWRDSRRLNSMTNLEEGERNEHN